MTPTQIESKLIELVAEFGVTADLPGMTDLDFKNALGLDSIDRLDLVMGIEDHFQITVTDEEWEAAQTIRLATQLVQQKLREKTK
jgi:acyl carrier protein